jgi:hypothetical protein
MLLATSPLFRAKVKHPRCFEQVGTVDGIIGVLTANNPYFETANTHLIYFLQHKQIHWVGCRRFNLILSIGRIELKENRFDTGGLTAHDDYVYLFMFYLSLQFLLLLLFLQVLGRKIEA